MTVRARGDGAQEGCQSGRAGGPASLRWRPRRGCGGAWARAGTRWWGRSGLCIYVGLGGRVRSLCVRTSVRVHVWGWRGPGWLRSGFPPVGRPVVPAWPGARRAGALAALQGGVRSHGQLGDGEGPRSDVGRVGRARVQQGDGVLGPGAEGEKASFRGCPGGLTGAWQGQRGWPADTRPPGLGSLCLNGKCHRSRRARQGSWRVRRVRRTRRWGHPARWLLAGGVRKTASGPLGASQAPGRVQGPRSRPPGGRAGLGRAALPLPASLLPSGGQKWPLARQQTAQGRLSGPPSLQPFSCWASLVSLGPVGADPGC